MSMTRERQGPLILVLEEEALQREAIASYLNEAGFSVIEAEDSDRAMKILKSRDDLRGFVTDAHVPGRTEGYDLARIVRERWPGMVVVLMSGHSDPSSGPVPEGAEFVAKPYLLEHLAPTLRRLFEKSDAGQR